MYFWLLRSPRMQLTVRLNGSDGGVTDTRRMTLRMQATAGEARGAARGGALLECR
jgi:hypothetical protein